MLCSIAFGITVLRRHLELAPTYLNEQILTEDLSPCKQLEMTMPMMTMMEIKNPMCTSEPYCAHARLQHAHAYSTRTTTAHARQMKDCIETLFCADNRLRMTWAIATVAHVGAA